MKEGVARAAGKRNAGHVAAPLPRGTLSQALILRASLAIIDHDGLTGLTVRKLADQLGVSAMAIYRHYRNKAEIERDLVDLVVGDYDVANHEEADWLAVMERILQELSRAGLTAEQSARLFHLLMANMIGSVVLMNEESRRLVAFGATSARPLPATSRKLSFEQVSLSAFPHIAELAPHLVALSEASRFRDSVMLIIDAVTARR